MNSRILFPQPKHIDEVANSYNLDKVAIVTTANAYPLIHGVDIEKRSKFPVKRRMDRAINTYRAVLVAEWSRIKEKMDALIASNKIQKMDYDNKATIDRIAKIPFRYKKLFVEVADEYGLNLSLIDKIVLNDSLTVNARFDHKKNLLEINPAYLNQHGMVRLEDGGKWISETSKTIIHEFGHVIYYNSLTEEDRLKWQTLSKFLQREQLEGDMSQYLVGEKKRSDGTVTYSPYYSAKDDKFVSVYARFNYKEDFSESFLYYKVAPEFLKGQCPEKFVFIEDKVGAKIEKAYRDPSNMIGQDEQINLKNRQDKFKPEVKDPKKLKEEKDKLMAELKATLAVAALAHYKDAFSFGKEKASYEVGTETPQRISPKQTLEGINPLLDDNDEYLESFVEGVSNEYNDILFTQDPYGNITGMREYDSEEDFQENVGDVMDTQEHRLGVFATTGISAALIAGMMTESETLVAGGIWHTNEDDRVCEGCSALDNQWMTFDEFKSIYGTTDCDGNCRCAELFEITPPLGQQIEAMAHSRMEKLHELCKGGRSLDRKGKLDISDKTKRKCSRCGKTLSEDDVAAGTCPRCELTVTNAKWKTKDMPTVTEKPKNSPGNAGVPPKHKLSFKKNGQNAYAASGIAGMTNQANQAPPKKNKRPEKIVAIDYHGTINDYGKVIEPMRAKMKEFKERGFIIIIYSAGFNNNPQTVNGIETFLRENDVPFDEVWQRTGKPDADCYIDDKSWNPKQKDISHLGINPEGKIVDLSVTNKELIDDNAS